LKLPDPLINARALVPCLAQHKLAFTSVLFVAGISKIAKAKFNERDTDLYNKNVNAE
jgi:hypothetical protein